ncbi:MAG: hypothetical protein SGI88_12015 [Candidatus Hydrogenedentes bacterium]|nr:hypothetical protein [Candidatus Hydrogenedentota bacterium]
MATLFLLVPLFLVLVTVMAGIVQVLSKSWLDYRFRIAFLDKLEKNPSLLGGATDLAAVVNGLSAGAGGIQRQNYRLTGLILAVLGVACAVGGRLMRSGEVAVGVYLGGVFCLVIGLVIALLGFMIHVMTRPAKVTATPAN